MKHNNTSSTSPHTSPRKKGFVSGDGEDEMELREVVNALRDEVLQLKQDVIELRTLQQTQSRDDSGAALSPRTPKQAIVAQATRETSLVSRVCALSICSLSHKRQCDFCCC